MNIPIKDEAARDETANERFITSREITERIAARIMDRAPGVPIRDIRHIVELALTEDIRRTIELALRERSQAPPCPQGKGTESGEQHQG